MPPLRREPFRIFFPFGVLLAWAGVGHWLAYAVGLTTVYSCAAHGVVQIQGFLLAFAAGFLLTAVPRRTQSAPVSPATMLVLALAQAVLVAGALAERWHVAAAGGFVAQATLLAFVARRFRGADAGRRPPPGFVLVPVAFVAGLAGTLGLAGALAHGWPPWTGTLGLLLVEQGLFLCLVVGVGSLVLPLMAGEQPPPDLGSNAAVTRQALMYLGVGVVVIASLVAEAFGSVRAAPLARGLVVAATLALGGGAARRPRKPGWNRALAWTALWLVPLGVAASGLAPDYRVPALHVTFIGGFGLLAFAVATHVTAGHFDMLALRDGRSPVVAVLGVSMGLALLGRVIADAMETYFAHLGAAALLWMIGSGVWLAYLLPRWWARR